MTNNLIAKPIVKNKFWILESKGEKVATIQANVDGSVNLVSGTIKQLFPSIKILGKEYNIKFNRWTQPKEIKSKSHQAFDIPTSTQPHNVLWNTKHKTAVYTEENNSKSYFCAGHFWVKNGSTFSYYFCPKLILLDRYQYHGPYLTKKEAEEAKQNDFET